jgi:hypothetical protein
LEITAPHFKLEMGERRAQYGNEKAQFIANFPIIKHAFEEPYVEMVPGLLEKFSAILHKTAKEFQSGAGVDGSALLAPFVAIVQSSGVGKTRLVYEHGKRHFTFFCCMREVGI